MDIECVHCLLSIKGNIQNPDNHMCKNLSLANTKQTRGKKSLAHWNKITVNFDEITSKSAMHRHLIMPIDSDYFRAYRSISFIKIDAYRKFSKQKAAI